MKNIFLLGLFALLAVGCSSAQKQRIDSRDRMARQNGLFCDFVNEGDYKDVDVELSLRMAGRCQSSKPFSISGYKRFNESQGFMYCCSVKEGADLSGNGSALMTSAPAVVTTPAAPAPAATPAPAPAEKTK